MGKITSDNKKAVGLSKLRENLKTVKKSSNLIKKDKEQTVAPAVVEVKK